MLFLDDRLNQLGIKLPDYNPPAANYIPYVITGNLVFISGQVCIQDGKIAYKGKLGSKYNIEEGQKAARICALNVLSQLKHACNGDFAKMKRCIKLTVFVNSIDEFTDQHLVANGASDLLVEVFGEQGRHARSAVGCASLPRNTTVEVEAIFELN